MDTSRIPAIVEKWLDREFWYERARIPENLYNDDFGVFDDETLVGLGESLIESWYDDGDYRGLALFGKPGRGKSLFASTMLCVYLDMWLDGYGIDGLPHLIGSKPPVYFITLADYQRLYLRVMEIDRMLKHSKGDSAALMEEWTANYELRRWLEEEAEHLVLDDVGKEHSSGSGYGESNYHSLVRGRFSRGLSTTITSNLSSDEFKTHYGDAQFSFLREMATTHQMGGPDYRTRD